MYFPVGWPRVLKLPPCDGVTCQAELKQVVCNRDKILTAIITSNALQIWYVRDWSTGCLHIRSIILFCKSSLLTL